MNRYQSGLYPRYRVTYPLDFIEHIPCTPQPITNLLADPRLSFAGSVSQSLMESLNYVTPILQQHRRYSYLFSSGTAPVQLPVYTAAPPSFAQSCENNIGADGSLNRLQASEIVY